MSCAKYGRGEASTSEKIHGLEHINTLVVVGAATSVGVATSVLSDHRVTEILT